jgi:pSer/pThr/pTyr-binding forkhead associated (FHA) protein
VPMNYGKLVLALPDEQEQEYELAKSSLTIGRSTASDIILMDTRVSRTHARLECGPQGCRIVDLGSSNGTRLNGSRIEKADLNPGDKILVGNSQFRYERLPASETSLMTVIDSEDDLHNTLASLVLPVALNETRIPRLVVTGLERTWEVSLEDKDHLSIGRSPANDLILESPTVSRRHAEIVRRGDLFNLRDLGSANGVWVGQRKVQALDLEDGAQVRIGAYQMVFKRGFNEEALTMITPRPAQASARLPVVFVPGFMGSELWLGSQRIWPAVRTLFKEPEMYIYRPDTRVEARGLLGEVVLVPNLVKLEQYNRLGDYLVEELGYERGCDFFEFPYDWRQDVRLSARKLGQAIESWPIQPPFILMAHSLGTLVSRYYVEKLGGKDKVHRLLLMGGPHLGTPTAATNLAIGPNLLPFGMMGERLRRVLGTFPSVYQILPTYACAVDQESRPILVLEDESWVSPEQLPLLRQAREFRRQLGTNFSVPSVSIFGYGMNTAAGLRVLRDSTGRWLQVNSENKPAGDDTIPERSAVLPQTEIHPVSQHHGSLYIDNDVKMRLKLELARH